MRRAETTTTILLTGLLGLTVFGAGCARHADVVELREEIILTQKRQDTLQRRLLDLEPKLDQPDPKAQEALKEAAHARQRVEELTARLQELENKLAGVAMTPPTALNAPERLPGPTLSESTIPSRVPTPSKPDLTFPSTPAITPTSAFNLAYNDYLNGRYELAISGFQRFLKDFPSSTLAPNAHYWIGESYYSLKDYPKAIRAFEQVVVKHPKSEKVAPALFKLGLAASETGDTIRARSYLKRVIEEFSNSDEAKLAKHKLAEIR
ncbi:MAG: tol-pal system protein YbgF [Nitrospirales bacterium]